MNKKKITFFLLLIQLMYPLQKQNNKIAANINTNLEGIFEGKTYYHILFNNKTEITLYQKPSDKNGIPDLFTQYASLIPHPITPSIKQIKYIEPIYDKTPKKIPMELNYNDKKWHEIEVTFTNNKKDTYLVPSSTKITMEGEILRLPTSLNISRLTGTGLTIIGIKKEEPKKLESPA